MSLEHFSCYCEPDIYPNAVFLDKKRHKQPVFAWHLQEKMLKQLGL
jgi:hypothetical protein